MDKKLWNRKLSCGHDRVTTIAFICKNYKKPIVGDSCYCRECLEDMEIVGVEELPISEDEE